jgi:hypothetical protein
MLERWQELRWKIYISFQFTVYLFDVLDVYIFYIIKLIV